MIACFLILRGKFKHYYRPYLSETDFSDSCNIFSDWLVVRQFFVSEFPIYFISLCHLHVFYKDRDSFRVET